MAQAQGRVSSSYRKLHVDEEQEKDLSFIFKGVLRLQLLGGEGRV